jgi:hypothetical protein
MAEPPSFERSVFINCPFDEEYAPILQAIAFCVTDLGFQPRLAPENANNAIGRLERITQLIEGSRYGIHDLSRSTAREPGEMARMNMPFELGLDHGCARFGHGRLRSKSVLVLESKRYDTQKCLSDTAGWDVEAHGDNYQVAIEKVRGWLVRHAGAERKGASAIRASYEDFLGWYWQRELAEGASEDEIRRYPTIEMVSAMSRWLEAGRPIPG